MQKTDQAARMQNDLKHFLLPFLSFRLYVQFKHNKQKRHFYGNEHDCTLSQVQHGHVPFITLSPEKGYQDLLNLIEKKWKDRLMTATIYKREEGEEKFNTICRRYYLGEIQDCNDPLPGEPKKIFYQFKGHELILQPAEFEKIDFKKEIENHLLKN